MSNFDLFRRSPDVGKELERLASNVVGVFKMEPTTLTSKVSPGSKLGTSPATQLKLERLPSPKFGTDGLLGEAEPELNGVFSSPGSENVSPSAKQTPNLANTRPSPPPKGFINPAPNTPKASKLSATSDIKTLEALIGCQRANGVEGRNSLVSDWLRSEEVNQALIGQNLKIKPEPDQIQNITPTW